jgi:hypothetical protein
MHSEDCTRQTIVTTYSWVKAEGYFGYIDCREVDTCEGQSMGAISSRVQADRFNPPMHDPGILPSSDMR